MSKQTCIAMWSGPRNLSTTLMRSFGARPDTTCTDEPFYAAYLALTGIEHPMRSEILVAHETDPAAVAAELLPSEDPRSPPIHYQKHMAHHMVPGIPRAWMRQVQHVFLIRHPARVIASYVEKTGTASLEGIGFPLQVELFQQAERLTGSTPVVVDSDVVLRDPERALRRVCRSLDLDFLPEMLRWSPGPKPEDGVWAPHWYDAVWRSSGFGPSPRPLPRLPPAYAPLLDEALVHYEALAAFQSFD